MDEVGNGEEKAKMDEDLVKRGLEIILSFGPNGEKLSPEVTWLAGLGFTWDEIQQIKGLPQRDILKLRQVKKAFGSKSKVINVDKKRR